MMKSFNRHLLPVLLIIVVSFLISWSLLTPGLHQIHDDQQVARLYLLNKALWAGQFPVRIVDGLGFGFGYPLFNFYPPFVYFLGEVYHILGFGFTDSIKLVFFASFLGSGVTMYLFIVRIWGRFAAVTASFFYMLAPYRALDVYVRGSLAEAFTFVWLPLILMGFYLLSKRSFMGQSVLCALSLAFLMITHNLIFLPFLMILFLYLSLLTFLTPNRKRFIGYCLASVLFSFGLTAFFWIPSLMEKKNTIVDSLLLVNLANYKIHFVYLAQLWNWPWGFGGSAEGLFDGISFKLGKLHVITSFASSLAALGLFLKNKISRETGILIIGAALLLVVSLFMTTAYSGFVWSVFTPLHYLQFPWRFLTFAVLFLAILSGALIYLIGIPVIRMIATVFLISSLLMTNLKLFKPQYFRPNFNDSNATSWETIAWDVSGTSFEYLPRGTKLSKNDRGANVVDISKDKIAAQKVEVKDGFAHVKILTQLPHKILFEVDAASPSRIGVNVANFSGWRLYQNGKAADFTDDNNYKLIEFNSPGGKQQYELRFENTPIRSLSNLISLFFVTIIVLLFTPLRKHFKFK